MCNTEHEEYSAAIDSAHYLISYHNIPEKDAMRLGYEMLRVHRRNPSMSDEEAASIVLGRYNDEKIMGCINEKILYNT